MSESNKTLIFGGGNCARNITEYLLAKCAEVIISAKDKTVGFPSDNNAEMLVGWELLSCRGTAGNFTLTLVKDGQSLSRIVGSVIIAEEAIRMPNFRLYSLEPSSNVISLSQLKDSLAEKEKFAGMKKFAFLTGLKAESNPVILREIMESALKLQSELGVRSYILTGNLKVGGNGLEALYRTTREAGVIYIKFTDALPEIAQENDGCVTLNFTDEVIREKARLKPDMVVADETISPSDYAAELGRKLELNIGPDGFLQSDNVHRLGLFTNRKGIIAAGPSRSVLSPDDQIIDAGNAAISFIRLRTEKAAEPEEKACIGSKCAKCLTCYRVCPYKAIRIGEVRPVVNPDACERCGICAAVCPACAITVKGLSVPEISGRIISTRHQPDEPFIPFIAAFCCKRSAVQARELALSMGQELPKGLNIIEMPCAGAISYEHIFSAFRNGADGVLILSCHEGNCHSEYGNLYAKKHADRITDILSNSGFQKERLAVKTLASNMAREFTEIVTEFEKTILGLGSL